MSTQKTGLAGKHKETLLHLFDVCLPGLARYAPLHLNVVLADEHLEQLQPSICKCAPMWGDSRSDGKRPMNDVLSVISGSGGAW